MNDKTVFIQVEGCDHVSALWYNIPTLHHQYIRLLTNGIQCVRPDDIV